jgi:hypothetical protein
MAEELRYESETAKADAISKFDESAGNPGDLDRIMNAPVGPAVSAEADITPPQSGTEGKPTGEADVKSPQTGVITDPESWAKGKGYASFAEARKAFDEKEALLKRQQQFIQDKISAPPPTQSVDYEKLLRRNQELEQLIAAQKPPQGAPPGQTAQKQIQVTENKIGTIKQALAANLQKKRALIAQVREDPSLQLDPAFMGKNNEVEEEKFNLDMQLVEEMGSLRELYDQNSKQLTEYKERGEKVVENERRKQLYEAEMDEIDSFVGNKAHPEFAFSEGKDSRTVEVEYVAWANKVASALYGSAVNMVRSEKDREAVAYALDKLSQKDPEIINACTAAGIPVEPTEDIRKYLDVCELLDHRDGVKKNPITGVKEQQYRVTRNQQTGQFEKTPVRFPSIEDAYVHRLAVDGEYNKRIKDAYTRGGKDMLVASQKRTQAPVTLDNAGGASGVDVGLALSPQQAIETLSKIDESEAFRRKLAGDPSLWNQYEKAMEVVNAGARAT